MRILFQGDSITEGGRCQDRERRWDKNHQIGHSYAYIVAGKLGSENPGKYEFINRGVSSDTVQKLEARWEIDALDENPDLLSILVGVNGNGKKNGRYSDDFDVHLKSFDDTYRHILDMSFEKNPSLKLIIMEPFTIPVGLYAETYNDYQPCFAKIQEACAKIAQDYNAVFIPLQKEIEKLAESDIGAEYWIWDGVHPTESTHWIIAQRWMEAAKPLLN